MNQLKKHLFLRIVYINFLFVWSITGADLLPKDDFETVLNRGIFNFLDTLGHQKAKELGFEDPIEKKHQEEERKRAEEDGRRIIKERAEEQERRKEVARKEAAEESRRKLEEAARREAERNRPSIQIEHLAPIDLEVTHWDLSDRVNLIEIGKKEAPLIFNNLRTLILRGCINLERVFLRAPVLQQLIIDGCSKLTDEMVDGVIEESEKLQALEFKGCPLIVKERDLRKKFPYYPMSYLPEGAQGKAVILAFLQPYSEYSREKYSLDTRDCGLPALVKALKLFLKNKKISSLSMPANFEENTMQISGGTNGSTWWVNTNNADLTRLFLSSTNPTSLTVDTIDDEVPAAALSSMTNLTTLRIDTIRMAASIGLSSLPNFTCLYTNTIGDEMAATALSSLTRLTSLYILGDTISDHLTGRVARALLGLTNLSFLYTQTLSGTTIKTVSSLPRLTGLDTDWNTIGVQEATSLSSLTNITSLNQPSMHKTGPVGAKALSFLPNLTGLGVYMSQHGCDLATLNLLSSSLPKLTSLVIGGSDDIGPEGVKSALPFWNNLTSLDFGPNHKIGPEGARSLSSLLKLIFLKISHSNVGPVGGMALSSLINLEILHADNNNLGPEGARGVSPLTRLRELNISDNNIGPEGAGALTPLISLTRLIASNNNISVKGLPALLLLTNLITLDVRNNNLGDDALVLKGLPKLTTFHY